MKPGIYAYIFTMFAVSFAVRVLPLTLIKKPITNKFVKSFLYYVPYATLAAMTFPTILYATQSPVSGAAALVVGLAAAWFGFDLFKVAVSCCGIVLLVEMFIM
ncbi:MAG: AzlD domain-containing protein [Oscillospiraceae bacterium]|nr:AzlD domain-containing protein [Oscillospiraceae bacterium]MBR2503707.1 AzlD domain-containing protein [Oscillospiraceae bacterium]